MRALLVASVLLVAPGLGGCTVDETIVDGKTCLPIPGDKSCATDQGYSCVCQSGKCECVKGGSTQGLKESFPVAGPAQNPGAASIAASLRLLRLQGVVPVEASGGR